MELDVHKAVFGVPDWQNINMFPCKKRSSWLSKPEGRDEGGKFASTDLLKDNAPKGAPCKKGEGF